MHYFYNVNENADILLVSTSGTSSTKQLNKLHEGEEK